MSEGESVLLAVSDESRRNDPLRRNRWAFYCMLGDLLKTHKGQFVAVHDRQVIASGPERMDVIEAARRLVGNVPIYVAEVSEEPPPVERVPSLRTIRLTGQ